MDALDVTVEHAAEVSEERIEVSLNERLGGHGMHIAYVSGLNDVNKMQATIPKALTAAENLAEPFSRIGTMLDARYIGRIGLGGRCIHARESRSLTVSLTR